MPVPDGAALTSIIRLGQEDWLVAGVWARDKGSELVLLTNAGGIVKKLPSPLREPVPALEGPILLGSDGELRGIVWLQGKEDGRMAVRHADWLGNRWGFADTVAAPGAGTQTALEATLLTDGSTLVLWSAFDGTDDEILFTLHRDGKWTTPERIGADNEVPDIVPAVVPAGGGALAAWEPLRR